MNNRNVFEEDETLTVTGVALSDAFWDCEQNVLKLCTKQGQKKDFDCGNMLSLRLTHCDLVNIPQLFSSLRTLSLAQNQISEIPACIGSLYSLETLNLSQNNISRISESFFQLSNLQSCDLSSNMLLFLPFNITKMKFSSLKIDNNPIRFPPSATNFKAIQEYFSKKENSRFTVFLNIICLLDSLSDYKSILSQLYHDDQKLDSSYFYNWTVPLNDRRTPDGQQIHLDIRLKFVENIKKSSIFFTKDCIVLIPYNQMNEQALLPVFHEKIASVKSVQSDCHVFFVANHPFGLHLNLMKYKLEQSFRNNEGVPRFVDESLRSRIRYFPHVFLQNICQSNSLGFNEMFNPSRLVSFSYKESTSTTELSMANSSAQSSNDEFYFDDLDEIVLEEKSFVPMTPNSSNVSMSSTITPGRSSSKLFFPVSSPSQVCIANGNVTDHLCLSNIFDYIFDFTFASIKNIFLQDDDCAYDIFGTTIRNKDSFSLCRLCFSFFVINKNWVVEKEIYKHFVRTVCNEIGSHNDKDLVDIIIETGKDVMKASGMNEQVDFVRRKLTCNVTTFGVPCSGCMNVIFDLENEIETLIRMGEVVTINLDVQEFEENITTYLGDAEYLWKFLQSYGGVDGSCLSKQGHLVWKCGNIHDISRVIDDFFLPNAAHVIRSILVNSGYVVLFPSLSLFLSTVPKSRYCCVPSAPGSFFPFLKNELSFDAIKNVYNECSYHFVPNAKCPDFFAFCSAIIACEELQKYWNRIIHIEMHSIHLVKIFTSMIEMSVEFDSKTSNIHFSLYCPIWNIDSVICGMTILEQNSCLVTASKVCSCSLCAYLDVLFQDHAEIRDIPPDLRNRTTMLTDYESKLVYRWHDRCTHQLRACKLLSNSPNPMFFSYLVLMYLFLHEKGSMSTLSAEVVQQLGFVESQLSFVEMFICSNRFYAAIDSERDIMMMATKPLSSITTYKYTSMAKYLVHFKFLRNLTYSNLISFVEFLWKECCKLKKYFMDFQLYFSPFSLRFCRVCESIPQFDFIIRWVSPNVISLQAQGLGSLCSTIVELIWEIGRLVDMFFLDFKEDTIFFCVKCLEDSKSIVFSKDVSFGYLCSSDNICPDDIGVFRSEPLENLQRGYRDIEFMSDSLQKKRMESLVCRQLNCSKGCIIPHDRIIAIPENQMELWVRFQKSRSKISYSLQTYVIRKSCDYKQLVPSICKVKVGNLYSSGCLVRIDSACYFITCYHVHGGCFDQDIKVLAPWDDGFTEIAVNELLYSNEDLDIAIYDTDIDRQVGLDVVDQLNNIAYHEVVRVMAFQSSESQNIFISSGTVAEISQREITVNLGSIRGNSGGALVNRFGQLLGIQTKAFDKKKISIFTRVTRAMLNENINWN